MDGRGKAKKAKVGAKRPPVRESPKNPVGMVRDLEKRLSAALAREAEALEQQTATSEILRVISGSPTDVQPVFHMIAENARRLCDAHFCAVFQFDGELIHLAGHHGLSPEGVVAYQRGFPLRPGRDSAIGRAILDRGLTQIPDVQADPEYGQLTIARAVTFRAIVAVPMLQDGKPVGGIAVSRSRVGPFSDKELALLRTFADQAAIAIENVRLFNEAKEALERQTATADVLRAISESPSDTQPVFNVIAERAVSLCGAQDSVVLQFDGTLVRLAVQHNLTAEAGDAARAAFPCTLEANGAGVQAIRTGRVVEITDLREVPDYQLAGAGQAGGVRRVLAVPLLRGGQSIGAVVVSHAQPGRFSQHQITMVRTFADQAVIAIENVRLFNETTQALERQTATAEILKVIARSPSDVQPVFEAIARSAHQLFGRNVAFQIVRDGALQLGAADGFAKEDLDRAASLYPMPLDRADSRGLHAIRGGTVVETLDTDAPNTPQELVAVARAAGFRSLVSVPLLRQGELLGLLSLTANTPQPKLQAKQIELLKTFADQAVIAIENVRLFTELQQKNGALTEAHAQVSSALEQQTATAEILRVIASTTTDLQPVFQTIADSAVRLCDGAVGGTMLFDGELIHLAAHRGFTPEGETAYRRTFPLRPTRANLSGRAIVDRTIVHVPDVEADSSLPISQTLHDAQRWRAALSVPMLRDGQPIGAISVARLSPGPFSEKQIALMQAFADQAVIAIGNVRLFKELEARTAELTRSVDQLTALGEVGHAVTSSLDLDTVLATIVSRAVQLTGLEAGAIYEYDERTETFDLRATERLSEDEVHVLRTVPLRRGEGAVGQTAVTLEPIQVPDITDTRLYESRLRDLLIRSGHRALLAVPLLRENQLIGALVVNRKTPGAFPPEIIDLLRTFATQSALAIQNARLFREIEDKSRQLEQASRHKSQFLASMSHELRTPLNAILGLNEMLLGEVYGEVPEDMKPPLVQTQASGRHLLGLINNVLDLAKIEASRLDLALAPYVVQDLLASVRATLAPLAAEKGLTFTASAPDDLPVAHGDVGRLTQCLINLAGNALKFTKEGRVELRVEPVEDRLRFSVADTGIGIAPDKIADLFTEFKQTDATIAREYGGTGLGLAITRKFIELHKGSIWVDSELGRGSTFIFEIPLQVQA